MIVSAYSDIRYEIGRGNPYAFLGDNCLKKSSRPENPWEQEIDGVQYEYVLRGGVGGKPSPPGVWVQKQP